MGIGGDLKQAALDAEAATPKLAVPRPAEGQTLQVFTTAGNPPKITGFRLTDAEGNVVSESGALEEGGAALQVDAEQFDGASELVKSFEALKAEARASLQPVGIRQYRLFYKRGNALKFGTVRPSPEYARLYDRAEIADAVEYMRTRPHIDGMALLIGGDERYNIAAFTQEAVAPNAFVFVNAPQGSEDSLAEYVDKSNDELSA